MLIYNKHRSCVEGDSSIPWYSFFYCLFVTAIIEKVVGDKLPRLPVTNFSIQHTCWASASTNSLKVNRSVIFDLQEHNKAFGAKIRRAASTY